MKAVVYEKYGPPDVLCVKEMEKPVPGDNEVLIRVCATSVTKFDCWQRSATAPPGFGLMSRVANGLTRPKNPILGTELSGEVESTGKNVAKFRVGDQVFGYTGMAMGTTVEYKCLPENGAIALKPANMTFEEAACVPYGALTSLYFLKNGNIQSGQKVLIFGASGSLGTAAVQLAKYFGAEVTGVCGTSKVELVKSLGADKVIDYTKEDFTMSGQTYDIIFDTVGLSPVLGCNRALNNKGYYLLATFGLPKLILILWMKLTSDRKVVMGVLKEKAEDLEFIRELVESGQLKVMVDKSYPLEQAPEAHRYVESGQKAGNVVFTI